MSRWEPTEPPLNIVGVDLPTVRARSHHRLGEEHRILVVKVGATSSGELALLEIDLVTPIGLEAVDAHVQKVPKPCFERRRHLRVGQVDCLERLGPEDA